MTHPTPCGQTCDVACQAACPAHPLPLAEVLARFEREGARGACDTGRYRLRYYTWGAGPPLVLVHGASDTSRSFLPAVARLAPHFSCVAYDLPNGYDDGARLGRYTHDHLVDDLWALLDHLKLERSYVLGSSLGGTVVLKALAARPGRLPRAVLQGGLAYRPLRRAERLLALLGRYLPGPVARIPLREKILHETNRAAFEGRSPEVWRAFVDWTGQARIKAFAQQALWLNALDLRPLLPSIRQPVLLVYGEKDRVVPAALTDVLLQGLPNAGRVVIPGCGHVPSFTHPEAYAEVVRQFLTPPA